MGKIKFNGSEFKKLKYNGVDFKKIRLNGVETKLEETIVISETLTLNSKLSESISTTSDRTEFNEALLRSYTIPAGAEIVSATLEATIKLGVSITTSTPPVSINKTISYDLTTSESGNFPGAAVKTSQTSSGKSTTVYYDVYGRSAVGFRQNSLLSPSNRSGTSTGSNFSGGDTMDVISAGKTFAVGFHVEASTNYIRSGGASTVANAAILSGSKIKVNITYKV